MIVDSSALLAILFDEPDAASFADALSGPDAGRISAVNFAEAAIVVDSRGGRAGHQLDTLMLRAGVAVEPVTETIARLARQAYADFGKGYHPAGLNFGDCFAYALAKATGEPLLFKGDDFARTDIASVL